MPRISVSRYQQGDLDSLCGAYAIVHAILVATNVDGYQRRIYPEWASSPISNRIGGTLDQNIFICGRYRA